MKLIRIIPTALLWACVATVALQALALGVLSVSGTVSLAKLREMAAVLYGVDTDWVHQQLELHQPPEDRQQPSYEDLVRHRTLMRLDLDLREMAVDKAMQEGRFLQDQLDRQRQQYLQLRQRFDEERAQLEGAATDEALLEVQRTLSALPPKQAKDQILRMLDDDAIRQDSRAMNDLVTIIKSMPLEKRKRIVAEFKTPSEQQQLAEILQKIRLGVPNVDLIRKTRQQLRQFAPDREKGLIDGSNPL